VSEAGGTVSEPKALPVAELRPADDSCRDWGKEYEKLLVLIPWLLLAVPTALATLRTGQTAADRAVTLALVATTAGWVYVGHTRAAGWRRGRTAPTLVYFAGMLAFSIALMARDTSFVLFAITGFFHAFHLRPWPLGAAAIFATSVTINTVTQGLPTTLPDAAGYVALIVIQSAAISVGLVLGEKGREQDEKRKRMVARLEAALEENAGLHAQLLSQAREAGVLDERQRMAGEIHDNLAQGLTGIITQVQAAQRVWHTPEAAREHLDRALGLARESLTEARRSVQALRPGQLEAAQLPGALDDLSRRWSQDAGVDLCFDVTGDRVALSPAIEVALFRVAQEALQNVARHAQASRVALTLSYLHDVVLLDVRDDGRGMNGEGKGFGLTSMRQRVRSVGGAVEIETAAGEGTAISARVPAMTMVAP
jgi:signal transduction histidine kinase